jgi:hypothetical protein
MNGKTFYFLAGYFDRNISDLAISITVSEGKLVVCPDWLLAVMRVGRPYLELSRQELISGRKVPYRVRFPTPAFELQYEKTDVKRTFTIGFLGLQWQRNRFVQTLREAGFSTECYIDPAQGLS